MRVRGAHAGGTGLRATESSRYVTLSSIAKEYMSESTWIVRMETARMKMGEVDILSTTR
jgi:hypothetical protein